MSFFELLLFCIAGIAGCATLVFVVETIVSFWLHEDTRERPSTGRPVLVRRHDADASRDKAA